MKTRNAYAVLLAAAVAFALGLRAPTFAGYNPAGPLPTRYVSGGLVTYVSATTAAVTTSTWRDSLDAVDVRSMSAVASVDCTAAGASGIDQTVIAETGSSSSPTITASADIHGRFNSATLQGNWSTSTTTATIVGPDARLQVAVGDCIGSTAKGWSRVTAVTSTTCTLVAALPGGDAAANSTFTILYSPTIWIAATASNKRMVNTISSAGTAIVVDVTPGAISTLAGGQVLTIGVAPNLASEATTNYWLHQWLRSGTSGTTATWSTQRITPYSLTGYTAAVRRVAAVPMIGGNATPVLAFCYQKEVSSFLRETLYEDSGANFNGAVLSAGAATAWTAVPCKMVVPPTSTSAYFSFYFNTTSSTVSNVSIRASGTGGTALFRNMLWPVNTTGDFGADFMMWQTDASQSIDYTWNASPGSTGLTLEVCGFRETL